VPDTERPRQIPLEFIHPPALSRDDLVVSQANGDAVALIERWPDWPSRLVLLAGPPGSGKSHLAAIWQDRAGASALTAERSGESLELRPVTTPLLIEDADRGWIADADLFHLLNAARTAGMDVLMTARRFPGAWSVGLPDLMSRLKAATTVEIHEPDDLLLAGVITKLFADRQVEVEQSVVQFLVRRIERSLSTAMRVVERLDRVSLEQKSRVTRILAAQTIDALDQGQTELDL